jgi:hypothetical protein
VSVLVCPGDRNTECELLLARALGARVGWLDPEGQLSAALDDTLPLGADGVLELPSDPMTIRAFLTRSRQPEELREPTEGWADLVS